jgi:hypothetical protein
MSLVCVKRSIGPILAVSLMATPVLSDEESAALVANPQYDAWAKCTLGSSSTVAMDVDVPAGHLHVEITTILRRVDDSYVTLDIKATQIMDGKPHPTPDRQVKYERWMKRDNLAELANQDVELQGKTYQCKVYEVSSGTIGGNNRTGGSSTIYLNDAVPGGVVKAKMPSAAGKPVVMILTKFETSPTGDTSKGASATPPAKPELASFDAFRFEVPAGWTQIRPDREKTKATILLNSAAGNKIEGMLKVDVGKPAFSAARQMAEAIAGRDGHVLPDPVLLDGTEGIRVETTSNDLSRPRFAVVAFREEKAYLIFGAGVKGVDVSKPFDQVLKTWRWDGGTGK